jgi:hypothetical protein
VFLSILRELKGGVSIVKLEGRFVSFKETPGEVIVFFPE